jgi:hypothetical protein
MEIVSPLSVGITAGGEIAAVDFSHAIHPDEFLAKMNDSLVEGIKITRAESHCIPSGAKKHSLSSLLWGFGYGGPDGGIAYIPAREEKAYREKCLGAGAAVFSLLRACVLAKNTLPGDPQQPWASYFDIYRYLHKDA